MFENINNFYQSHPKEVTRFAKFALVGALGAIIDFALLNLMLRIIQDILGWDLRWTLWGWYTVSGNLLIANTFSVSVAILSNFSWNRLWTFPESRARKKRTQLPQFVAVNLVGLLINNVIVVGLDALLLPHIGEPWSYNLAKAVAIGVVLFWNFGANRLWTYRGL